MTKNKRRIDRGYIKSVTIERGGTPGVCVQLCLPFTSTEETKRIFAALTEHCGKYVELSRWVP